MVSLTWRLDPHRGWTGTDPDGHPRAHIVEQPDPRWPWSATSWRGWVVECSSLERAKELMDRHASDPLPPGPQQRARRRFVRNEPGEAPPHPGTHARPPS
jgi:hypothetical protein